jgi:hypothetical protein
MLTIEMPLVCEQQQASRTVAFNLYHYGAYVRTDPQHVRPFSHVAVHFPPPPLPSGVRPLLHFGHSCTLAALALWHCQEYGYSLAPYLLMSMFRFPPDAPI